jgi:hypothetical protein
MEESSEHTHTSLQSRINQDLGISKKRKQHGRTTIMTIANSKRKSRQSVSLE